MIAVRAFGFVFTLREFATHVPTAACRILRTHRGLRGRFLTLSVEPLVAFAGYPSNQFEAV